jgi:succinate dehydrogenase flavin-adding protein (antitoxin of CptAB toxin-antitoxin module)
MYRAKQRGHLELDLLIGRYAEDNLPSMNMEQLKEVDALLVEENPDLWTWLTGQGPAPEHVQANSVFKVSLTSNWFLRAIWHRSRVCGVLG